MGFRNSMVLPDNLKPPPKGNFLRPPGLHDGMDGGHTLSAFVAVPNQDDCSRFLSSYSASFACRGKPMVGGRLPPLGRVGAGTFASQTMNRVSSAPDFGRSSLLMPPSPLAAQSHIDPTSPLNDLSHSTLNALKDTKRLIMELLADPDLESKTRETFALFDKDADAKLTFDDLMMVLQYQYKKLGLPKPEHGSAQRLFKKFDNKNRGELNFNEFFQLILAILRQNCFDNSTLLGRDFFVTKHKGSVWERYENIKQLGEGSFGTAYLVKQRFTGEKRVVKSVKKSRVQIPVEDVEKEIIVMRQVDHPHIVRLRRWYEDSQKLYLVMDVCNGGTLRDVLLDFQSQRRGLKEAWIRTVTMQVAQAMAYCHSLRLIHKDIKDENIMLLSRTPSKSTLSNEPFAVVIDLGIAEMFSLSDPQGKDIGGTPTTMAPEVWLGTFGPKCDVWSLGCVLFELLTGGMPFTASSLKPQSWIKLHKRGPALSRIKTSGASKELCKAMLTFVEDDRPTMQELLQDPWFEVAKTELRTVAPSEFESLRQFTEDSALKRGILLELASRLPMEDADRVVQVFESYDKDCNGVISPEELSNAFQELGMKDPTLVQKVFKVCDLDSDGHLSFTEFSAIVLVLFKDLLDDRLDKLMAEFDTAGDGSLNPESVQKFLSHVGRIMGQGAHARSTDIINDLQNSGGRSIKFQELKDKLLGPSQDQEGQERTPMSALPRNAGGSPAMSPTISAPNLMRSPSGAARNPPTPMLGVSGATKQLSQRSFK